MSTTQAKTKQTKKTAEEVSQHDHAHGHTHADQNQPKLPIAANSQVSVTIPWATIEPAYQKAVRRFARNAKVDGFRKGKVPAALAEKMVDQSALVEHVLQTVLPDAYSEAIKAADKKPISQPEVDPIKAEKGSDWEVVAYFAEAPKITLGKYQDTVKKAAKEAQKEIKEREEELKKKAAEHKDAVKDKKDDTSTEEKAPEAPATELTDAQKDDIKVRHIFRHLVERVNPQIAELLVRREADRELRKLLEQLDQLKLSVESYLQSRNMNADQLRLEYISSAATSLQLEFTLAEIGKAEKITAEDKEVDETLERVFGDKLTDAQRQNTEYRSYIYSSLVKQKIAKHLLSLT
jgi:FKBP-type peptidyl-prolyl cis-trans isomerase (trigger factor)